MENNFKEILENAKKNSIGANLNTKVVRKSKQVTAKVVSGLLAMTILFSLTGCKINLSKETIDNSSISTEESDYSLYDIAPLITMRRTVVKGQMDCVDIKYYDEYGRVLSNDVETYKRIKGITENDLFGYYLVLGKDESEKVLPIFNYSSWDDYLIKKGYINDEGKPDIKMWEDDNYIQMQEYVNKGRTK